MVSQPAEELLTERIARARTLAREHPAVAELLTFYADLAEFQKQLLAATNVRGAEATPLRPSFRDTLDPQPAIAAIPAFLDWLSKRAPAFQAQTHADWPAVAKTYVRAVAAGPQPRGSIFVAAALVQPFAEQLAAHWPRGSASASEPSCPICGAPPVVGVLRQEGQGARRRLLCSFCLTERDYMRVVCPSCGEKKFDALPIYTAEQFGHVRVEACDSCRTYLKTIDLTKNGLAVPVVDDIASVSLDLWARERGYERLQRNLLGL